MLIADQKETRHQAAVLYIKSGLSLRAVADELGISKSTVQKWSDEGRWQELCPATTFNRKESEKLEAAVLFIKHGLSMVAISEKLNVSMRSLKKWKDAGRWDELRPDLEIMNQYKASAMYLQHGMSIKDISINLSIPESTVNIWADLFGWNVKKQLIEVENMTSEILDAFCHQLKMFFPNEKTTIDFAKNQYLKSIEPKI